MKERKLTGNEMFEVVKEECERILVKVEGKGKKRRKVCRGVEGWENLERNNI